MTRSDLLMAATVSVFLVAAPQSATADDILLFSEPFEDTDWKSRGWYDGPHMEMTSDEHIEGSTSSCVWSWPDRGAIGTTGGGGRVRFTPVDEVTLSFHIKHGANWTWTGVPWHPHEFHFITDVDDVYVGPSYTHLTFYVEAVNGVPRVAIQDGRNIDEANVGVDLVDSTENRSVAGCNGDSDGHGEGDCYSAQGSHQNGKFWEADGVYFGDDAARSKTDWHHVRTRFRLNSVSDGVAANDGVIQYWLDGQLLMDHRDVVFRTNRHPDMMINQFLMAPYFGPGVPHEQKIWIDDLRIYTAVETDTAVEATTWGVIKGADLDRTW